MPDQTKKQLYYEQNKDKWKGYAKTPERLAYQQEYYSREDIKAKRKAYLKAYYLARKEAGQPWCQKTDGQKIADNKRRQERKKTDVHFRLKCSLRSRLSIAIKRNLKSGSAVRDLGCSIEFFRQWIEFRFQDGMTWENWGSGRGKWSIDHFYPLNAADLSDQRQFLAVNNFRNLQPMWNKDNEAKADTVLPEAERLFNFLALNY
jgi:hypothetical protein